jgi:hypothetical protein
VVEAVAYHHAPSACPARRLGALTAVHAADVLAHEKSHVIGGSSMPGLDMEYLGRPGLADRIPVWRDLIEQATREQKAA